MSLAIKHFDGGLLSPGINVLYTVPDGKSALVRVTMVNKDDENRAVNIWFNWPTGSPRLLTPYNLDLLPRYRVELDIPFSMEAGSTILGGADVADVVEYLINGVLEDLIATV